MSNKTNFKQRHFIALVITALAAVYGLNLPPQAVTGLTEITCQAIDCEAEAVDSK